MVPWPYPEGAASKVCQATGGCLNLSCLQVSFPGSAADSFYSLLLGKWEIIKGNLQSSREDIPKFKSPLIFASDPCLGFAYKYGSSMFHESMEYSLKEGSVPLITSSEGRALLTSFRQLLCPLPPGKSFPCNSCRHCLWQTLPAPWKRQKEKERMRRDAPSFGAMEFVPSWYSIL